MTRLAGQVTWIGGGASGIGAAVAELFAAEGAKVAVADVQAERGEELVRRIGRAGGQALFTPTDVTREAEVAASIEQAIEQFGGLTSSSTRRASCTSSGSTRIASNTGTS